MKIQPARTIRGRIRVPGDKSISHRAAIVGALALGSSTLHNFSTSADCASTVQCLRALGVPISQQNAVLQIKGVGIAGFIQPPDSLDCGNSGTTMRLLAGVLAGHGFNSSLIGDQSLSLRPMKRVIEPLESMGASVTSNDGKPPLTIKGTVELQGIDYTLSIPSAQVKSAILLAGIHAKGTTSLIESLATRDHTERMMRCFGGKISSEHSGQDTLRITVTGREPLVAREVDIPGDISSAAFFIAAAALLPDSAIEIVNVGLNPTRTQLLSILQLLGLEVRYHIDREECNEPSGRIIVRGDGLPRSSINTIPSQLIPQLIDELPLLGVLGARLPGGIEVRGASELRLKETDRIEATVANLRAMGVEAEEFEDGFAVRGSQTLRGAQLNSYGDHRIAMAFTVAALIATEESELLDPECVAISFPEFFHTLDLVVQR